jgi:hypothetical protein
MPVAQIDARDIRELDNKLGRLRALRSGLNSIKDQRDDLIQRITVREAAIANLEAEVDAQLATLKAR